MTKNILMNATMCLTSALLLTSNVPIKAAEINTDTAVAGITVSLDKFYAATLEKQMEDMANEVLTQALTLKASKQATAADTVSTTNASIIDDQSSQEADNSNTTDISPYENIGISIANNYVNIRSKANEESKILGKLYKGSSATILETDGEWVKIQSGSVEGYIMSSYLAIGDEAEKVAEKYGTKQATVTTTTLKVREKNNLNSIVLTLIPEGETYDVIKEYKSWVKVQIDEDLVGFVSKYSNGEKLVDITMKFTQAISIEEEQAKIAAEEAAKRAEQEEIANQKASEAAKIAQSSNDSSSSSSSSSNSSSSNSSSSSSSSSNSSSSQSTSSSNTASSSESSSNASDIVSYAMQFLGNPYVYGGTSLTNGTDCSGFTMQLYSHFGYSIPRTSRDQANAGQSVSFDSLQKGDLIFYTGSEGTINHVAMYIGGGQVIHASNPSTGIRTSNMYYRTPCKARRIMN